MACETQRDGLWRRKFEKIGGCGGKEPEVSFRLGLPEPTPNAVQLRRPER
jgi:hypothetical protein